VTASLSGLIRLGFRDACDAHDARRLFREALDRDPRLGCRALEELPRVMHSRQIPACRQDQVLAATIRAYRHGPPTLWGPVLLSMLAPALVRLVRPLRSQPPAIDDEDLDQQVVVEALRSAALMPLPENCRFVQRRLTALTGKRLMRWLQREGRLRASQVPMEKVGERAR
jgi:hypothetical protein